MKNKKFQPPFALLFVGLFLSVIQISGCDSTKGENIPSSPSGAVAAGITISASPASPIPDTSPGAFEETELTFTVTRTGGSVFSGASITLGSSTNATGVTASFFPASPLTTNSSGVATSFLSLNTADIATGVNIVATVSATVTNIGTTTVQITFCGDDPCL